MSLYRPPLTSTLCMTAMILCSGFDVSSSCRRPCVSRQTTHDVSILVHIDFSFVAQRHPSLLSHHVRMRRRRPEGAFRHRRGHVWCTTHCLVSQRSVPCVPALYLLLVGSLIQATCLRAVIRLRRVWICTKQVASLRRCCVFFTIRPPRPRKNKWKTVSGRRNTTPKRLFRCPFSDRCCSRLRTSISWMMRLSKVCARIYSHMRRLIRSRCTALRRAKAGTGRHLLPASLCCPWHRIR